MSKTGVNRVEVPDHVQVWECPPPRGPKRLRNTAPAKGYDHVEYCPSKSIYVRGIVSPLRDKGKPFGDPW